MNLGATLSDLATRFTRDDQVQKLNGFAEDTPGLSESTRATLRNAVERANKNIEWDRLRLPELVSFFRRNDNTETGSAITTVCSNVILAILSTILVINLNDLW